MEVLGRPKEAIRYYQKAIDLNPRGNSIPIQYIDNLTRAKLNAG